MSKKILETLDAMATKNQDNSIRIEVINSAIETLPTLTDSEQIEISNNLRAEILSGVNFGKSGQSPLLSSPTYSGPRTSEELWHCVKGLFSIEIPLVACSDYSNSPFEWFSKVYFGKSDQSVALASRNSGKTFLGSILHYLWNTYSPNHTSRHAAATKEQAKVASGYLQQFSRDPVLSQVFEKGTVNKLDATWQNNSHWAVVTGSLQGVSGQHPNKSTWDEIEFWDIDAIEQTFYVPTGRGDNYRIWAAFPTRQRSFGAMNWLVEEAPKRGIDVFLWTAFETMQRCVTCVATDNSPHGTDADRMLHCVLWEDCYGKKGTKSSGWVPREDVCKMKRSLSKQAWEVQGLCSKPSSHGLVLHNFEHEFAPAGNYTKWIYTPELPWYAVHDPSEGKKSVIYCIQVDPEGRSHMFDEIISPSCPSTNHAKAEFYEFCLDRGYGDPEKIIVDPHRTDAIADWKIGSYLGEGINHKYNAEAPPIDGKSG